MMQTCIFELTVQRVSYTDCEHLAMKQQHNYRKIHLDLVLTIISFSFTIQQKRSASILCVLKSCFHTFTYLPEDMLNTIYSEKKKKVRLDVNQPFLETSNSHFLLLEEICWSGMSSQHYCMCLFVCFKCMVFFFQMKLL